MDRGLISGHCSCLWLKGPSNTEIFSKGNAHKTTQDISLFVSCTCPFYHYKIQFPGNQKWHQSHVVLTFLINPQFISSKKIFHCSACLSSSIHLLTFLLSPAKASQVLSVRSLKFAHFIASVQLTELYLFSIIPSWPKLSPLKEYCVCWSFGHIRLSSAVTWGWLCSIQRENMHRQSTTPLVLVAPSLTAWTHKPRNMQHEAPRNWGLWL